LKANAAVELFLERTASDSISPEEIYELLVMDNNYPIHKLKLKVKAEKWN